MTTEIPTSNTPSLPEESQSEHQPRRSQRKLLLDDGEGDYRVFKVHPGGVYSPGNGTSIELPKGTLIPMMNIPGFFTTEKALKHIKNQASQHNSLMSGLILAVIRFCSIVRLEVSSAVRVDVAKKPKREASAP